MKKLLAILILFSNLVCAAKLKSPLQAGWKGKKVCEQLSENDQQRILRCTFPPGVGHEKHQHNAHFGYALSGGKMQLTDDKGTRVVELATNSYFQSQGKKWHQVLNMGDTTVIYLMIESKTPNSRGHCTTRGTC